jgi:hypothetical protein
MSRDLATSKAVEIASGTNRRLQANSAVPPIVRVDGDRIAYTEEDATTARPFGWKIVVRSLASGRVERTYLTAQSVYAMALSGSDVLYTEGLVDQGVGFMYRTRLMLATPNEPAGAWIADDAFEVAFRGSRFAWDADPGSSQGQLGMAQHPQVMTATVDSRTPVPASYPAAGKIQGSVWPTTGDDLVAWSDDEGTDPTTTGNRLGVWAPGRGAFALEPAHAIAPILGGDGWLTWYDDSAPGIAAVIHGVQVSTLAAAR